LLLSNDTTQPAETRVTLVGIAILDLIKSMSSFVNHAPKTAIYYPNKSNHINIGIGEEIIPVSHDDGALSFEIRHFIDKSFLDSLPEAAGQIVPCVPQINGPITNASGTRVLGMLEKPLQFNVLLEKGAEVTVHNRVVLHGLNASHMNGKTGTKGKFHKTKGRFSVKLDESGKSLLVKEVNLRKLDLVSTRQRTQNQNACEEEKGNSSKSQLSQVMYPFVAVKVSLANIVVVENFPVPLHISMKQLQYPTLVEFEATMTVHETERAFAFRMNGSQIGLDALIHNARVSTGSNKGLNREVFSKLFWNGSPELDEKYKNHPFWNSDSMCRGWTNNLKQQQQALFLKLQQKVYKNCIHCQMEEYEKGVDTSLVKEGGQCYPPWKEELVVPLAKTYNWQRMESNDSSMLCFLRLSTEDSIDEKLAAPWKEILHVWPLTGTVGIYHTHPTEDTLEYFKKEMNFTKFVRIMMNPRIHSDTYWKNEMMLDFANNRVKHTLQIVELIKEGKKLDQEEAEEQKKYNEDTENGSTMFGGPNPNLGMPGALIPDDQKKPPPKTWPLRGFVRVNPDDTNEYPAAVCRDDPSTFVPQALGEHGRVRKWGLYNDNEDPRDEIANMMRDVQQRNNNLHWYRHHFNPKRQFINALIKRKIALKHVPEIKAILSTKLMVLRVALLGCEDKVWRRIIVPAATSLAVFHDQILISVMGWARAYHGYVFEDPTDGTVFGPQRNSGYIDMMHAEGSFHCIADDRRVPLGLLLQGGVGAQLYWTYDLGDKYEHVIVLEELQDMDNSKTAAEAVVVIDGCGACPPEDGNGIPEKYCRDYAGFLSYYKKKPKKCRQIIRDVERKACNYCIPPSTSGYERKQIKFNPLVFDLEYHRQLLAVSIAGPRIEKPSGLGPAGKGINEFRDSTASCAACGDTVKVLKKCACLLVRYCSPDCQKSGWKEHKLICPVHIAKKKAKRKKKKKN